jgi:hypothetical protein
VRTAMRQHYHVLIRRSACDRVLADCRVVGWLLPIATADARMRPPLVVSNLLDQLRIAGSVVCVTCGLVDPRGARIDWLAVIDEQRRSTRTNGLSETTVEELLNRPAVVAVQPALLRAYRRGASRPGSALSIDWLADAVGWAKSVLPDIDPHPLVHRADLFEAVWAFNAPRASVFLKWRGEAPFVDPDVAALVGGAGPLCVPVTLANDRIGRRWLASEVGGIPLTADLRPVTLGRVVEALARTQVTLLDAVPQLRPIDVRAESLEELATEADRLLDRVADRGELTIARDRIRGAFADLDALQLPATWIHTDFVPENVFVDAANVSVIDFDDPWIGSPPVAMEFLFSGLRRHIADPPQRAAAIRAARERYVEVWRPLVAPETMRRAFASTRIVAEVLRVSGRLRALAVKEARGELVGLLEPAARESARRLAALAQR